MFMLRVLEGQAGEARKISKYISFSEIGRPRKKNISIFIGFRMLTIPYNTVQFLHL